jgi:sec-independent protein translocase protein TatB
MFEIGFSEILVIALLALLVLGPEKLPKVAAQLGRWTGRARAMARNLRTQLEQEVSYEELLREKEKAEAALRAATSTQAFSSSPTPTPEPAASTATPTMQANEAPLVEAPHANEKLHNESDRSGNPSGGSGSAT